MKRFLCTLLILMMGVTFAYSKQNRLASIKENNELRVCTWPQYYGISYIDPRTQKLVGLDSDLSQELAKDLGVKLKLVKSSFPTLINDVTQNRCDIAMFAIGHTKSRSEKMRFTTAHLKSDIYAVATKTNKRVKNWEDIDKKGVIVAVAKGTYHEPIMKKRLKNAQLMVIKGFKQREEEVHSGRADVFMTDYPYGKRMLAKTSWARLIEPRSHYHITPYAWTMAYEDDAFYERVEAFIAQIKKDGRLLHFAKKYDLEAIVNVQ